MFEFWLAVSSSVATVATALIAVYAIKQSSKNQKENYANLFIEKLDDWYKDTLHILKSLFYLPNTSKNSKTINELLIKLSENIDYGRGYFKNINSNKNQNKPELFKGNRVLPISLLVMYHHIFEQGLDKNNKEVLRNIERAFISEVAMHIEQMRKQHKIIDYKLTDQKDILLAENLQHSTISEIFNNKDIVKFVKIANEETKPAKKPSKPNTVNGETTIKNFKEFVGSKYGTPHLENKPKSQEEEPGMELKKK